LEHRGAVPLVAVALEPVGQITSWLEGHKIRVQRVIAGADLVALGFGAVPTLLVADSKGVITDIVSGEISLDVREAVLARVVDNIGPPLNRTRYAKLIDRDGLQKLRAESDVVVLDTTSRGLPRSPREGVVYIPRDELEVRGPIEIGLDKVVVVDCSNGILQSCDGAGTLLISLGVQRVFVMVSRISN
jgi:hypothetical protein